MWLLEGICVHKWTDIKYVRKNFGVPVTKYGSLKIDFSGEVFFKEKDV